MSGGIGVSISPGGVSVSAGVNLPRPSFGVPGLFIPNSRSIGPIHAQVTIDEQERDELTITEFPVEQGAPVSDHAYKRPSEVTIRAAWSVAGAGDLSANGGGIYAKLLQWQAALMPFNLVTGKRTYSSMLIQSLVVTTDSRTEFALMAEIHCKQVIIVATQTTQAAVSQNPNNQADPGSNATPSNKGDQQPKDAGDGTVIEGSPVVSGSGEPPGQGPAQTVVPVADVPDTIEGDPIENTVTKNTTPEQQNDKGFEAAPFTGAIS
jgi:hypothetical protein